MFDWSWFAWLQRLIVVTIPTSGRHTNPLYMYEVRRVRHLKARRQIFRYVAVLSLPCIVIPILFALGFDAAAILANSPTSATPLTVLRAELGRALGYLLIANGVCMFMVDLAALTTAVTVSEFYRTDSFWELVLITTIRAEDVIEAKQAATELRAWRATGIELALRAALGSCMALITITLMLDSARRPGWLDLVLSSIAVAAFIGFLIYEPYWRMRATVAIGLRIAAREANPAILILRVISRAVILWMARIVALVFALFVLLNVLLVPALVMGRDTYAVGFTVVGLCVALFASTQGFYNRSQLEALYHATVALIQHDRFERRSPEYGLE